MATLAEVRQQYPQYSDMSDGALADALYGKFYSDMPRQDFDAKIGLPANTELLGTTPAQGDQPARVTIGTNPQPDRFQQAAIDEQAALKAQGIDPGAGLTRRLAHGATLGADSTILAALETPLEMVKRRTFNPVEGYNFAKAREDKIMGDARDNPTLFGADVSPYIGKEIPRFVGTAAEILGGGVSGAGLASGGLTSARMLAPEAGLLARAGASAADAGAVGGFSGAMEGNGLAERGENALKGAGLGLAIGGLAPFALSGVKAIASPIASNIKARVNPEGYAQGQVARAVHDSGLTPGQVGQQVTNANAAGQGVFTVADALGNPGQRMLSTVARAPGQGRTDVVNFLESRQAGQGDRLLQITDDALGAGATARQTSSQLTKKAQGESAPLYQEALNQKPVWNERIQQFFDDPITKAGLKEGVAVQRLESLAQGKKFDPNDYAITGFNEAGDPIMSGVPNMRTINLIKKGWDKQLEGYRDSTTGRLMLDEYGRALDSVRRSFLTEVDAVNPVYAKARALYAGPAQVRDAVAMGGKAAGRGRAADNLDQFNALPDASQQGFRTGYADRLSQGVERGAFGVNKVRPLTSDKAGTELKALSLHQGPVAPGQLDPLSQRLAREQTMFETRNQALGGSRTADNLADADGMGVSPELVGFIGQVLHGNIGGAVRYALQAGSNFVTGNTPAVRQEVANILLQRGPNMNPAALENMVNQIIARMQRVQSIVSNIGRGASGGLAVTGPGQSRQ